MQYRLCGSPTRSCSLSLIQSTYRTIEFTHGRKQRRSRCPHHDCCAHGQRSPNLMVSVGVSSMGCTELIFIEPRVKIKMETTTEMFFVVSIFFQPFVAFRVNFSRFNRTTLLPTAPMRRLISCVVKLHFTVAVATKESRS